MGVLKFDENYNVKDFTFILSTRGYTHQGALSNVRNVTYKKNLNSANEISFDVYKFIDGHKEKNWNKIKDLKLIYIKDLDEYYTINVSLKDSISPCKSITATSLCESELSQTMLYDIEINTELDIARDDYDSKYPTIFYRTDHPEASLLHRILNKAPHYKIKHVDASLAKIQRTFSISGTSIYDFFTGECSEQFHCIFQFDTTDRSISVYDLYTVCQNEECGYRGEYDNVCPECGCTDLKYYGEDTHIYVDKDNLAEEISLETDVDSIKNCFKLVAGDDYMTATVININPNGTPYIYYISNEQKEDMSKELVDRVYEYDELYNSKTDEYSEIMKNIYECIDKQAYYTHEMMPDIDLDHEDILTAQEEANKLTKENMSPVALNKVTKNTMHGTVNNAVKNYAKVYVKTGYFKVEINESKYEFIEENEDGTYGYGEWTGNFKITNYSNEEDVAYSSTITIKIEGGTKVHETFLKQKVDKLIAKDSEDDESIYDVLGISDLDKFKESLTHYCFNRLESFKDAIQGVIDIMIEDNQASEEADLYEAMYEPYSVKMDAVVDEMNVRQKTIAEWESKQEEYEKLQKAIQSELNFEDFLGAELYEEFCAYRREDTYENSNFISDGLDNDQIFNNAQDFLDAAKKELFKSGERQQSISTTLFNLLVMKEFKPIVNMFDVGNWIRIGIDGSIYRLRLIAYEISFEDLQTINVEFSNITKIKDGTSDVRDILDSAQSMASSYSYVSKQAEKGKEANEDISDWLKFGLDSSLVNIKNNANEEITYGKHGLLARSYDDITESYSDEQLKITHNILCFTEDNWKTSSLGLGKHKYKYFNKGVLTDDIGYGLSSKFVTAGYIYGSQIISGDIYSENYTATAGTHINLNDGSFSFAGGKLTGEYDKAKDVYELKVSGRIESSEIEGNDIKGGTIDGTTIKGGSIEIGEKFTVTEDGVLTATDGNFTGTITAENGTIGGASISDSSIYTTKWQINKDGTASFKDVLIDGVSAGSVFGGISYNGTKTDVYVNNISANTSFDVTNGALSDFNDLVVKNITAENIKATNILADYATVNSLNAVNANFSNLNASNITSGTLSVDRLDADTMASSLFTSRILTCNVLDARSGVWVKGEWFIPQTINGVRYLVSSDNNQIGE